MAGIRDVAMAAGVSVSTVSRVLSGTIPVSEQARLKVLAAVKELDYHPNPMAQGLKGQSLKTLALIIPNVRNLVFPAAIKGIEDTARRFGYTLILCNTDEDHEREMIYIRNLRRRFIDGFIISTARDNCCQFDDLLRERFPMVFLIRHPGTLGNDTHSVILDNVDGGYQAVKYLIEKGHRQIALINGDLDITLYRHRFDGYKKAFLEAGLQWDERLVIHGISGWEESYRVMKEFIEGGIVPDAVFATNDPKAIGVYRAIKDCNLSIPGDISVIGFDNSDISAFLDPPLTTVAQPFYEMGSAACKKLIALIEKKKRNGPKTELLPAHLVIRQSVR